MELDELKNYLNRQLEEQSPLQSSGEISAILRNKSIGIVHRIRKNLWIEFIISLLAVVVILYAKYLAGNYVMQIYFNIFLAITLLFLPIFGWLIRSTYQLSPELSSVKTNLTRLHLLIARFTRFYFIFSMAIFLPVVFYSLIAAVYERNNQSLMESLQFYMHLPAVPLLLIGLYILVFGIFLFFFARWYIRLLYGKYLDKLKDLLMELNTPE
jgi:hypothetical protein